MNMSKKIILASTSPRRKELLEREGIDFIVDASFIDETLNESLPIEERLCDLARRKAFPIHQKYPNDIVIGADTVVVLDNKILGKPDGYDGAFKMLKSLSGRTHIVVTSIVVINSETGEFKKNSTTSEVTFEKLTDEQIKFYIDNFKPFDKAGSYGIQEMPAGYIKSYTGDLENIIGISSKSLAELLSIKV